MAKRIIILILAGILTISMTGCIDSGKMKEAFDKGRTEASSQEEDKEEASSEEAEEEDKSDDTNGKKAIASGIGSKKSDEDDVNETEPEYADKFEKADHDKYTADSDDLEGTMIWTEGKVESFKEKDMALILEADDGKWAISVGTNGSEDVKSKLEDYVGKKIRVYGCYAGYADSYDMPVLGVVEEEFTGDAFRIETPDGKNRMTEIAGYWDDPEFDYRGGLGNLAWNMTSAWLDSEEVRTWDETAKNLAYYPFQNYAAGAYLYREKLPDAYAEMEDKEAVKKLTEEYYAGSSVKDMEDTEVAGLPASRAHIEQEYDGIDYPFEHLCYIIKSPDGYYYALGVVEPYFVSSLLEDALENIVGSAGYGYSWFADAGLKITPQGDFKFKTSSKDGKSEKDVTGNISIEETTDGAPEGCKKVKAVVKTKMEADGYWWLSVFDRYTGTSFEFGDKLLSTPNYDGVKKGYVRILHGDDWYDIAVNFDFGGKALDKTSTVTVTCPADYDGTVFQLGYSSKEIGDEFDKMDLDVLHTIDEFPAYDSNGHEYLYFSALDE
jgi:hypothetical protein